uniref:pyruvate kinase n=1 Tax=Eubacterium cellulosolvens TaxID=29322 RepID=UPI00048405F0|nr:pyruvate kinase [[Eubacterium] cellulosolvens]
MKDVRLFSKIENREGVRNLEEIITACDLVVIARGDLGSDMPLWELPAVQKQMIVDGDWLFLFVTNRNYRLDFLEDNGYMV